MICILDTSAALELFFNRAQSSTIQDHLSTANLVVSPDLYCSEISNVFWKLNKMDELSRADCESGIETCLALVDDLLPMGEACSRSVCCCCES